MQRLYSSQKTIIFLPLAHCQHATPTRQERRRMTEFVGFSEKKRVNEMFDALKRITRLIPSVFAAIH